MPQGHPLLAEFQSVCQEHYTCYIMAVMSMNTARAQYASATPANRIFIGPRDPSKYPATASMRQLDLHEKMKPDGEFADTLAKSLLVEIYSDWDEYFRPNFATAIGAEKNKVRCDLLGDLRHIRNCIVHDRSVLSAKHTKLATLRWSLAQGELHVTQDMFTQFMDQVNQLEVTVEA